MAAQRSRRSRKRRGTSSAPRAVASQRRERRVEREVVAVRERQRGERLLGSVGERPPGPFGGLPVSEIAIFAGAVALVVGFITGGGPAVIVGIVVTALGVVEVTAREHFSGYRSHTTLLAAIPAVGVEVALVEAVGKPHDRGLLLLAVLPVFGILFWLLRQRFRVARQARLARPPSPGRPGVG